VNSRSDPHRLEKGVTRGRPVEIIVDGQRIKAYEGETIAAAMINAGQLVSRTINGKPLGVYCNMGICHSCVMTVNGTSSVRICQTKVSDGCRVESQHLHRGDANG
jgi:predicted molibdopterin-dependent oxidoreductase YjgC